MSLGRLARSLGGRGAAVAGGVPHAEDTPAGHGLHRGLLSTTASKSHWQLAEAQGEANPYGFQHRLVGPPGHQTWPRMLSRAYVIAHLGDPKGGLTGFLKKGTHSTGVGWPHWGMVGRIENCPAGIFVD